MYGTPIPAHWWEHPVHLKAGRNKHSPGATCAGQELGWSQQSWALPGATVPLFHVEFVPLDQGVSAWDAQPLCTLCHGGAHLDVIFGWTGDTLASLAVPWLQGQPLTQTFPFFPCRNRLGKHILWECGAGQKDANRQPVAFPAQALPIAPVPPPATAPRLSPGGEGSVERDMWGQGSACVTSLELRGW